MSEQLTQTRHRAAPRRAPVVRQVVVVLVGFAVAGVLAGVAWEYFWSPAMGTVMDNQWLRDEPSLAQDFSGTGLYVLIAALTGLVLGAVVGVGFPRAELLTLLVVLVGSVLAGALMYEVGVLLGPPDPRSLAATTGDGVRLPSDLRVVGWSSFGAFPTGALVGLVLVFLGRARDRGYQH